MRRVVVTGMGMVTPLGQRRRDQLVAPSGRPERRRARDPSSRSPICRARSPAVFRAATARMEPFNPDLAMEPKEQRKVDDFIIYAMAAADEALADSGWQPKTDEEQLEHRRPDRLRHRRHRRDRRGRHHPAHQGPAAYLALLHSRPPDQPRLGPRLHQAWAERAEPRGRHRLLHRLARHRRRGPPGGARRCGRDGRRRHRVAGEPHLARRLRRLPRSFHRL